MLSADDREKIQRLVDWVESEGAEDVRFLAWDVGNDAVRVSARTRDDEPLGIYETFASPSTGYRDAEALVAEIEASDLLAETDITIEVHYP